MPKQLPLYAGLAALFVVSFLVLNWVYGYVIEFQNETNDCFFMFGRPFLLEFFDHPAGPIRYAGRFLGQLYYHRWLGALVASACITCFGFLFHHVLAKLDGTAPVAQTLLPCVLLLALHTSTIYLPHDTLGLCASCGAFLGYLSLRATWARRVYALVATPVVYLCLGVYAWVFVAWVVALEWLDRPLRAGLVFKIGYVVFSLAVPLIAWRWIFLIPLRSALVCPVMFEPPFRTGSTDQTSTSFAVDCTLAVLLCAFLLVIPLWGRLFSGTRFGAFWQTRPDRRSRIALAIAIPALAILFHWIRYDAPLATVVACRRLYKEERWDALLQEAKENPYGDLRVQFMTNFALYHKGRLLEEMFSYPQPWGPRGLFMNFTGQPGLSEAEDDTSDGMYNSDLLYEMGHANYALIHAHNCLCLDGKTYDTIKRMAECSMVNGNYETARKYLNLLEKTLFYRDFARRYKAIIADPDAAEREFADSRRRLPTRDGFGSPAAHFFTLLDARPDNRMALEYLMAWLLLEKSKNSIETICACLGELRIAGYASIPTHCQEAVLLKERGERTPVDLQGFRYDGATVARMDKFIEDVSPYWGRSDAPEQAQTQYGDTYMFYYFFVTTPADTRRMMEAHGGFSGTEGHE